MPLHLPQTLQNDVELQLGVCGKKQKSNHLSYLVAKMYGMRKVLHSYEMYFDKNQLLTLHFTDIPTGIVLY